MRLLRKVPPLLQRCAQLLLPHYCILCGAASQIELDLCAGCLQDLARIKNPCKHCGIPLTQPHLSCGTCLKKLPPYDYLLAPFHYQQPISYMISAIKFHKQLSFTRVLGNIVANELVRQPLTVLPELILPIPLHPDRLKERGYNQALELAKPISHLLQIPIDYRSCIRIKATQAQTGLRFSERVKNIKNAFHLDQDFYAKKVALFDDVVTTGSTIAELCKVLKAYGVEHIQVWSCARTSLSVHKPS